MRMKVLQDYLWIMITLILLSGSIQAQQTITGNILHKGLNRTYRLRLPANHNTQEIIPLVFNLHGFTSNATQQELYSGMNAVADTARFAVCYPNGIATSWNVGWNFGSTADDVGFISVLIDELINKYNFDSKRIFACGMSNGGFMSFRLACELSNKIAAVASVTGSVAPGRLQSCKPDRPVPVMAIHGTADDVVIYNGSLINLPIEQVVNHWVQHNQCDEEPGYYRFPDINQNDNSTAEAYIYNECNEDAEVLFIKIIGGGHTWPGGTVNNGVVNRDIHASTEIWRFFSRFSLPGISSAPDGYELFTSVSIYPNPATDIVFMKSGNQVDEVNIADLNGRVLMYLKPEYQNDISSFTVQQLNPGMYFINIISGNSKILLKFVKI